MSGAPKYFDQWHEEDGPVLWWKWPIEESPYVGTPLDLGYIVEADLSLASSCGSEGAGKVSMLVGGWPFGEADGEGCKRLWWTRLPDDHELDRAIRDEIRGYPEP